MFDQTASAAPGPPLNIAPRRERLMWWTLIALADVIAWAALIWFIMLLWRVWGA